MLDEIASENELPSSLRMVESTHMTLVRDNASDHELGPEVEASGAVVRLMLQALGGQVPAQAHLHPCFAAGMLYRDWLQKEQRQAEEPQVA